MTTLFHIFSTFCSVGECSKEVSSLVGQYFSLLAEEDYDVSLQSQAFGLTAALSVLNILLENGLDKSKLSSKYCDGHYNEVVLLMRPLSTVESQLSELIRERGIRIVE